jgi:hypothetical protein
MKCSTRNNCKKVRKKNLPSSYLNLNINYIHSKHHRNLISLNSVLILNRNNNPKKNQNPRAVRNNLNNQFNVMIWINNLTITQNPRFFLRYWSTNLLKVFWSPWLMVINFGMSNWKWFILYLDVTLFCYLR